MNVDEYYNILGISKSASDDDVKKAYRKLSKKWHPDINKSNNAEEMFKKVNIAYEKIMEYRDNQKSNDESSDGFNYHEYKKSNERASSEKKNDGSEKKKNENKYNHPNLFKNIFRLFGTGFLIREYLIGFLFYIISINTVGDKDSSQTIYLIVGLLFFPFAKYMCITTIDFLNGTRTVVRFGCLSTIFAFFKNLIIFMFSPIVGPICLYRILKKLKEGNDNNE